MLKVEGHNNLFRDTNNGAILNNNVEDFKNFKALYTQKMEEKIRLSDLEQKVSEQGAKLDLILELLKGK